MGDIFAAWKRSRFIVADPELFSFRTEDFIFGSHTTYKHHVILTDVAFFAEHMDKVDAWCEQNACKANGMTVAIPDDKTLMLFILRWS